MLNGSGGLTRRSRFFDQDRASWLRCDFPRWQCGSLSLKCEFLRSKRDVTCAFVENWLRKSHFNGGAGELVIGNSHFNERRGPVRDCTGPRFKWLSRSLRRAGYPSRLSPTEMKARITPTMDSPPRRPLATTRPCSWKAASLAAFSSSERPALASRMAANLS